ncbi:VWA domain-containing protein [Aestuariivirga sp.]|uniref:VWA domain-containing protein n=1 Tax=Aestuariivirga sp. TaxID=2650926 RepID=UPI0025C03DC3|nr:VWA domain-containing protein [Aestuariivirga sp.]MCA3556040.1 VWA domain-containing protein [Aestuariivirga sp.]
MSSIKRQEPGGKGDVEAFLARVRAMPAPATGGGRGRLVLAMDATMSRQPSWDMALSIQGDMFAEAGRVGGLDVQLVYFRGFNECRASKWTPDTAVLARMMSGIRCQGGRTQIGRVLKHLKGEAAAGKVNACIYIGDALEEAIDPLAQLAGEIGLLGIPVFMFQEGGDPAAEAGFREIARLTRGAYFRFGSDAGKILRELLAAVAVYAAGGFAALENHSARRGGAAALLLGQMK